MCGQKADNFCTLQVSHRGLRALRRLGALQRLSLASCQHLDDDSLAALPAFSSLRALSLERSSSKNITARGMSHYNCLPSGQWSGQQGAHSLQDGVPWILDDVQLLCQTVTPACCTTGFDALAALTALEELNVGYTAAPQASVLGWTTLQRLRLLSLDSCAIEDRWAAAWQDVPQVSFWPASASWHCTQHPSIKHGDAHEPSWLLVTKAHLE